MASLLTTEELGALDDLYFTTHQGEAAVSVYNCGRQLDNIGQLAGIADANWTAKDSVTAVIVRDVKREVLETFAEPERLQALYRARYAEAGKVLAGDVLAEADGTVWLAFEPSEYDNGRPRVRAGLELVPGTMVPATLRSGGAGVGGSAVTHRVDGTFVVGGRDATATVATPVPASVVVFAQSSRLVDPDAISLDVTRTIITFTLPLADDPWAADDWIRYLY